MNSAVPFASWTEALQGGVSVFDGRTVTKISFAELAEDVARVRERLVLAGVEVGSCIGILGENCYEYIVHDLAVLSLGCVSVCFPIDEFALKSPEELANSYDLSLLLVTRKVAKYPRYPWVVVMNPIESWSATVRRPPSGDFAASYAAGGLRQRLVGTDVCSVIFSSGTSGKLKALLLSRAGVDVTIEALANDWRFTRDDGILVALPLSIFQQRLMIYAAIRRDADILLTDPSNLFRCFKALRPTFVLAPPALFETVENRFHSLAAWQRLVRRLASAALGIVPWQGLRNRLRKLLFRPTHEAFGGRVRALLTGSAPSKLSTLEFYRLAGLALFQAYGLAEVGFIAWNRPGHDCVLSVGRPVVEGSVSIADDGEILVGVPHRQAIGYFGVDPAEEALTFLPDGRVATGDLGRFDRQGYLFITGRKKDLIITQSGQKIHPETLERDLSAIRGVVRAVVIGGGDVPGLVAIVAVDPNSTTEHEAQVQAEVQSTIELLNKRMPAASRIGRSIITRKPFRPETGLLTRNLKLDRRAVQRYFERDIMQGASQASEARPS